jgi:hypothetical protein
LRDAHAADQLDAYLEQDAAEWHERGWILAYERIDSSKAG